MKCTLVSALVFSTIAGSVLPSTPAVGQMTGPPIMCAKRIDMIRQLDQKYGESRHSMGLAQGCGVFEMFASEMTGSWTILLTGLQGATCLMAAGEAFQVEPVKAVGNPT